MTRDNRKNPEYRVVAAIRKLRTDTNCPAGKPWPNHVKNEQHVGFAIVLFPIENRTRIMLIRIVHGNECEYNSM